MRRRVVAGALLALAVLAGFVTVVGPARLARDLSGADPVWAGLVAVLAVGGFLAWGESLRQLFAAAGTDVPGPRFRLVFLAGVFAKQLLPAGNASGPALIAYAVTRETDNRYEHDLAVATVGELFNLAASVVLAAAGIAVVATRGETPGLWALAGVVGLVALAVFGAAVLLFVRRRRFEALVAALARLVHATAGRLSSRVRAEMAPTVVAERLGAFGRPIAALAGDGRRVAAAAAYSLLGWGCTCLALFASAVALGHPVSVVVALFVVPVGGVASAVPLPGGVGGVEVATAALLVGVGGLLLADATATVLLFRLATFWLVLTVGGLAAILVSFDPREVPAPAARE